MDPVKKLPSPTCLNAATVILLMQSSTRACEPLCLLFSFRPLLRQSGSYFILGHSLYGPSNVSQEMLAAVTISINVLLQILIATAY